MTKEILENSIEKHLSALAEIGRLPEGGYLRAAWSDEETQAMEYIAQVAHENGLEVRYDAIGNLYCRTPRAAKVIQVGSHLDTVPQGGNYDGVVGIVAGLEAILAVMDGGSSLGYELVVWRAEESGTFGHACMGSRAAFGLLDSSVLAATFSGSALEEAIRSQGYNPNSLKEGKVSFSVADVVAHIELHIEQGQLLEKGELDIGIVTSIRGAKRFRVEVEGEAAHSGSTPMGTEYRKDANLAVARMQVELAALTEKYIGEGKDLVQTVGVVNSSKTFNESNNKVYENALTKVSPYCYFLLDFRSSSAAVLESYQKDFQDTVSSVAEQYAVAASVSFLSEAKPVENLDPGLQQLAAEVCKDKGYKSLRMPSGAGHDVAVVAGQGIPATLLFIPCRGGISHNPLEYASVSDIKTGSEVIKEILIRKAGH